MGISLTNTGDIYIYGNRVWKSNRIHHPQVITIFMGGLNHQMIWVISDIDDIILLASMNCQIKTLI